MDENENFVELEWPFLVFLVALMYPNNDISELFEEFEDEFD